MKSNILMENEQYLREAINSGITSEAVNTTITDMLDKSDEMGKTPVQVKKSIRAIIGMKKSQNSLRKNYVSNLVSENSEEIINALKDGIRPEEIAVTFIGLTNNNNPNLKFMVKLISKMKQNEIRLDLSRKNNLKNSKQKVFTLDQYKNVA